MGDVYATITSDMAQIVDDNMQMQSKGPIWIRPALEMETEPGTPKSPDHVFFMAVFQSAIPRVRIRLRFEAPPTFNLRLGDSRDLAKLERILQRKDRSVAHEEFRP